MVNRMTGGSKIGAIAALMAAALLSACIPGGDRTAAPRPPRPTGQQAQAPTLQCHIDMARENIGFRVLPDRTFENGCSARGAVQLTATGTPTTNLGAMTCGLALNFARWSRESVQPAAQRILGSAVASIETMGTYSCRPVNGQDGERLSEHGTANAVDVSAFVLANGRRITVLDGWNSGDEATRRFLRTIHRDGCARFSVGLGPDANRLHANHLHFDMGARGTCR